MPYDSAHGKLWQDIKADVDKTRTRASKFAAAAEWAFGKKTARVLGVLALFAVVVALLFVFLNLYVAPTKPSGKKDLVLAVAQILAGTALLSGLYFTWRTLQVNREGQITERFTRAIDQLGATDVEGSKLFEIRLGGIHALERIARESEKDYWPIIEVLTAYVRQHARRLPDEELKDTQDADAKKDSEEALRGGAEGADVPASKLVPDIKAIMTVIRRRARSFGKGEPGGLDLRETNLRGADLRGADLGGADLREAFLREADLREAILEQAKLQGAKLGEIKLLKANLYKANLQEANLYKANLQEANLQEADLQGAEDRDDNYQDPNFSKATLREVNFQRANLQESDLFRGILYKANLLEARLRKANLQLADLTGAELYKADLQEARLNGAELEKARLGEANLRGASLRRARLRGTNLAEADLQGANLEGAKLEGANLHQANLEGANLQDANLSEANLSRANLKNANVTEGQLADTMPLGLEEATMPDGSKHRP